LLDIRDKIAFDCSISAGAVSNIVNEWSMGIGSDAADQLRDLSVTLKKIGMNPVQCAIGVRVATIMKRLGVHEDKFESFILDVYNRCYNELGLTPERIGFHITNLAKLSDSISPLHIPNYIMQKTEEKKRIEEQIEELESKMKELQTKKYEIERSTTSTLEDHRITSDNLRWYSDIKEELEKTYGMPVSDISKFTKAVQGISQNGYDVGKVIKEFSDYESARSNYCYYKASITDLEYKYNHLNQECSKLQQWVNSYNQKLSLCGELEDMGFGLKELKLLRSAILEIADANNITRKDAGKRFFKDVEEHYDDKLGFESKIQGLQEEVNNLNQRKLKLFAELNAIPKLAPLVVKLFGIVGNNSVEEFDLLIDQVLKAGGIRASIRKLGTQPSHDDKPVPLSAYDDNKSTSTSTKDIQKEQGLSTEVDPLFKRAINESIAKMLKEG
jgi:prefoldin subunit 5